MVIGTTAEKKNLGSRKLSSAHFVLRTTVKTRLFIYGIEVYVKCLMFLICKSCLEMEGESLRKYLYENICHKKLIVFGPLHHQLIRSV